MLKVQGVMTLITSLFFLIRFLVLDMLVYTIAIGTLCRCFMENQVLAEFVRLLKISNNLRIEATLLQYLGIMIQNLDSEHAICKLFLMSHISKFSSL